MQLSSVINKTLIDSNASSVLLKTNLQIGQFPFGPPEKWHFVLFLLFVAKKFDCMVFIEMARCIEAKISSRKHQILPVNIKQEPLENHPSFQCSSCPESFEDASKLAEHQGIHLGNNFQNQIQQSKVCVSS